MRGSPQFVNFYRRDGTDEAHLVSVTHQLIPCAISEVEHQPLFFNDLLGLKKLIITPRNDGECQWIPGSHDSSRIQVLAHAFPAQESLPTIEAISGT